MFLSFVDFLGLGLVRAGLSGQVECARSLKTVESITPYGSCGLVTTFGLISVKRAPSLW